MLGHFDAGGTSLRVLTDVTLPSSLVEVDYCVSSPEGMQQRPAPEILHRVIGPVVSAPALDAFQVAAVVHEAVEEGLRADGRSLEEKALGKSPRGRFRRLVEHEHWLSGQRRRHPEQETASPQGTDSPVRKSARWNAAAP